ncbi:winged helix-turn-helix domain-containing protein [Pseudoalteromonas sp. MMG013]|uniref:LamG-like jellyroll fold domain-containing protein n=1 Tax=Pseudoalteromonas sp. MMG013 TaxID=2822687 RepID=UPI001B375805|nr:LamG-like jellyroll fold domain-containing protein [Pseudoalteromonas sp. MMG013]MBQ4861635.1 winged helix-turn-helix domain-containing protein [Pseudoalteromonas sp. MMG013]
MNDRAKQLAPVNVIDQIYRGVWISDLFICFETRKVYRDKYDLNLSELSYKLLICLINNSPNPIPTNRLLTLVWGDVVTGDENVKQRISILRKQLDHPQQYDYIKNRRGQGYFIDSPLKYKKKPIYQRFNLVKTQKISFLLLLLMMFMLALYWKDSSNTAISTSYISKITDSSIHLATPTDNLAFCLDGYDDYVELPDQDILDVSEGDFSISTWVRTRSLGQHLIIDKRFENQIDNVHGYAFYIDDGYLALQLADGGGTWYCQKPNSSCTFYDSSAFVATNEWQHIAVSIDRDAAQGIRFYRNGSYIDSHNPTDRQGSLANDMPLRIGSRSSYLSGLFQGAIGEISLHHKVLTSEDIRADYLKGNPRHCYNIAHKGGKL